MWRIRSFPGEHFKIRAIRPEAKSRPITAQTIDNGTPALRRSRAKILMFSAEAQDCMEICQAGKGYFDRRDACGNPTSALVTAGGRRRPNLRANCPRSKCYRHETGTAD